MRLQTKELQQSDYIEIPNECDQSKTFEKKQKKTADILIAECEQHSTQATECPSFGGKSETIYNVECPYIFKIYGFLILSD